MIWTAELWRLTFRLRHHRSCMMAADVEECAGDLVITAHDDKRLACEIGCDVLTGLDQLISTGTIMPCVTKNCLQFEIVERRARVPGRWDGRSAIQRSTTVVAVDKVLEY